MPSVPLFYSFPEPTEEKTFGWPFLQKHGIWIFSLIFLAALSLSLIFFKSQVIDPPKSFTSIKNIHPDFVGREEYLKKLNEILLNRSRIQLPIAVLWGEGGIGKSEIATTFANEHLKDFAFIYWIDSATEDKYRGCYCLLAEQLAIPFDDKESIERIRQKVHSYLETVQWSRPWLLVFDNIESALELPQRGNGAVLMTSRNKTLDGGHHCLEVRPFHPNEAHKLIEKITKQEMTESWHKLLQELEYFPLTVNLASHYITTTPGMTPANYLRLLNAQHAAVLENMPNDTRYPHHLLASWKVSANFLKNHHPETFEWLQLCSYLHPDAIPVEWIAKWLKFKECKDDIEWKSNEILRTVIHQSFMRYNEHNNTLSLHRLKQEALRKNEEIGAEVPKQALSFLAIQIQEFNYYDELEWRPESWEDWRKWEPHAKWWISNYKEKVPSLELSKIFNGLGNYHTVIESCYDKALACYQEALKLQSELLRDQTHPDIAWSLSNVGKCWVIKNDLEKGRTYEEQALKICRKLYGDTPQPLALAIKHALGDIKKWQFKNYEALRYFEDALKIQKKLYPSKSHPSLSECLMWIGLCWSDIGYFKKALFYLEKALEVNTQIYGSRHTVQKIYILQHLGKLMRLTGNLPKATQYLEESLKAANYVYIGKAHTQIITSLAELGLVYNAVGNYKKALLVHEKTLKMCYELFPNGSNFYLASTLLRLGEDWHGLGKDKKALEYYNRALAISREICNGKSHRFTAYILIGMGKNWCRLGNLESGIQFLEEALKICKEFYEGGLHRQIVENLELLGMAYRTINPQKANDYLAEAKAMADQLKKMEEEL